MWLLMNDLSMKAKIAFNRFLCDEEGDVNIVSIVVLCGIAIILAIAFKDGISDLLTKTLFPAINTNAENAIKVDK